jgi:hypothetical protein
VIQRPFGDGPDDAASRDSFAGYPVTGFFCTLAPGGSIPITYSALRPPAVTALVDIAVDDRTGHVHAGHGAIAFITVK